MKFQNRRGGTLYERYFSKQLAAVFLKLLRKKTFDNSYRSGYNRFFFLIRENVIVSSINLILWQ